MTMSTPTKDRSGLSLVDLGRSLPRPIPASVRFRATAWATAALALLLLLSGVAVDRLVTREVRTAADTVLNEQARDRATLLAGGATPESLVTVIGEEAIAAVFTPSGAVAASAGTPEPESLLDLAAGVQTASIVVTESEDEHDAEDDEDERAETHHTEELRIAVIDLDDGSRIVLGSEGEQTRQTINNVRGVLMIGGPLLVGVGGLILWFLTGRAFRPVYRMRDDLERVVEQGTEGRVTEPGTRDEIDDLATTLNHVLEQLELQSAARRRFVADASHELKSPVANVRALIETAGLLGDDLE